MHKYESLGWEYRLAGTPHNTPEQLDKAQSLFSEYFDCVIMN
jgi:pyruvate formate lyase activating enzyme